jgi:hypothetical protein
MIHGMLAASSAEGAADCSTVKLVAGSLEIGTFLIALRSKRRARDRIETTQPLHRAACGAASRFDAIRD